MGRAVILLFVFMCSSFAQTPAPDSSTGIEGVITRSPIHGGPARADMPSSAPVANTTFAIAGEKGAVSEFTTDDNGHFQVSLAPGHYSVTLKEKKGGIGHYGPFNVDVTSGQMTKVEWHCDTGMR
jgi:Prealbumin-like fold domain